MNEARTMCGWVDEVEASRTLTTSIEWRLCWWAGRDQENWKYLIEVLRQRRMVQCKDGKLFQRVTDLLFSK